MHVLDHVFILCSPGAPEATSLARFGLTEGSSNTHPGQGTACRRFFFHNAYLELLWVSDVEEAQSPISRATRLFDRWSARKSGASPFGVVLRPSGAGSGLPPFQSWKYRPAYLPSSLSLDVAVGTLLSEPELFYFGSPRGPGELREQPVDHAVPLREVTSVRIAVQGPPTLALQAVEATGLVAFPAAAEPFMLLGFLGADAEVGSVDFRPELPLALRW
jgi:Glyoxalase-like domain